MKLSFVLLTLLFGQGSAAYLRSKDSETKNDKNLLPALVAKSVTTEDTPLLPPPLAPPSRKRIVPHAKSTLTTKDTPLLPPPLVPPSDPRHRALQMTMSEEDEPGYQAAPVAAAPVTATAVLAEPEPVQVVAPVVPVAETAVLAEPEPAQVVAPAVPVAETAVLAEPEPAQVAAPIPETAVLAEPEPAQVAAPVVPVAVPEPVQVAAPVVPVAVPAAVPSPVKAPAELKVSSASPNGLWATTFSKHTTDEALLALFDMASQLKSAYLSFDINGDGTVSEDEVSEITNPSTVASLRRLGMELAGNEEPEQVVATAELPTPEEAAKVHQSSPKLNTMFDLVEKLTIAHTYFDADRDGTISAADLISIAKTPQ
jgi:hypothetical protein